MGTFIFPSSSTNEQKKKKLEMTRVWFQLVDSSGAAYKDSSPSKVSPPDDADVDDFRKAVKTENPNKLSSIDAADLKVYANKASFDKRVSTGGKEQPLDPTLPLNGLGGPKDMLFVVVPGGAQSVSQAVARLDIKFSTNELKFIRCNPNLPDVKGIVEARSDTKRMQARLAIQNQVWKRVRKSFLKSHQLILNGSLSALGQGQTKSSVYLALSAAGNVLAVKVFSNCREDFDREISAREGIGGHPNIVPFQSSMSVSVPLGPDSADSQKATASSASRQSISVLRRSTPPFQTRQQSPAPTSSLPPPSAPTSATDTNNYHAICMPVYPRSAKHWLKECSEMPQDAIKVIVRDCFSALCHIHSKGYCYADLKPSNVMLDSSEAGTPRAILIDFGGAVPLHTALFETTEHYVLEKLGRDTMATEVIDWTCLGSMTAELCGVNISTYSSKPLLIDRCLQFGGSNADILSFVVCCLQTPLCDSIKSALDKMLSG